MPNELRGYDPFAAGLRQDLRATQRQLHLATAHPPSRWARLRFWVSVHVANRWLDAVLLLVPGLFIVAALATFVLTWPWDDGRGDMQQVVVGCASVVALGSIIVSAITLPVGRSADLGPGFTVGLIRRARFWLLGLTVAPISAFLFWLAANQPDRDAAFGAALLAGGAFAGYWAVARKALSAADSLEMARRESQRLLRQLTRFMIFGERLASSTISADLRDIARDDVVNAHRVRLALGPIRQLRSSARRLFARGDTDEGLVLYGAMVVAFTRVIDETKGAIGDYNGVSSEVIEAADDFIRMAMDRADDFVAVQLVEQLASIARLPVDHPDVAEARLHARARLSFVLDRTWSDDASRVGPTASGALSGLVSEFVRLGAREEALQMLDLIAGKILRAQLDRKPHLSQPAMDGFVLAFGAMALVQDARTGRWYLSRWVQSAQPLVALKALPDSAWIRPQDQLLPGTSLTGGVGLQSLLLDVAATREATLLDVTGAICDLLDAALPGLAQADQRAAFRPLSDALALLLCCSLLVVRFRESYGPTERAQAAERIGSTMTSWIGRTEAAKRTELLCDEDIAEMVWSNLLAIGCIAESRDRVVQLARVLVEAVELKPDSLWDGYVRAFIAGLYLITGSSTEEVDDFIDQLRGDRYSLGGDDYGMHIPPLGRAPSCNRNRTAHYESAVDDVNTWALSEFPTLGASN